MLEIIYYMIGYVHFLSKIKLYYTSYLPYLHCNEWAIIVSVLKGFENSLSVPWGQCHRGSSNEKGLDFALTPTLSHSYNGQNSGPSCHRFEFWKPISLGQLTFSSIIYILWHYRCSLPSSWTISWTFRQQWLETWIYHATHLLWSEQTKWGDLVCIRPIVSLDALYNLERNKSSWKCIAGNLWRDQLNNSVTLFPTVVCLWFVSHKSPFQIPFASHD